MKRQRADRLSRLATHSEGELFDVYMAIDWSARSKPSPLKPTRDSIWIGENPFVRHAGPESPERYCRTRHECLVYLKERLAEHIRARRRVFVGFDFAFGYPQGFARAIHLDGQSPPWQQVWDELSRLVKDNPDNSNNRFEVAAELNRRCGDRGKPGPFWGCPAKLTSPWLKPTSPGDDRHSFGSGLSLAPRRFADQAEPKVQPVWKLMYAGSVGSQTLLGIPVLRWLRNDPNLGRYTRVWPMETKFTRNPMPKSGTPFILVVEIWPGVVEHCLDPSIPIRDQAQVRAVVGWLAELDKRGRLGNLFAKPEGFSPDRLKTVLEEECWILGVGQKRVRLGHEK